MSICFAQRAHTAALGYSTDCIHISLPKEWLKSQKTVKKKKYRSYLLLHHHLQRLSPEKNTTECHFLLQLLKKWKQFNKNEPPPEQQCKHTMAPDCTFQSPCTPTSSAALRHNHTPPSPPFSFGYCFCQPSMQRLSKTGKHKQCKSFTRPKLAGLSTISHEFKIRVHVSYKAFSYLSSQNPLKTHTHTNNLNINYQSCAFLENFNLPSNTNQAHNSFPPFANPLCSPYALKAKEKEFYHNFRVSSQK